MSNSNDEVTAGQVKEDISTTAKDVEAKAESEVKEAGSGIIAHLEAFGEFAEEEVKAAIAWLSKKL